MTIALVEHADSRQLAATVAGEGQRLRWTAYRSTSEAAIRAALLATAPVTWDGLTLVGFGVEPYKSSGIWDCTADYGYSNEQAGGVKSLSVPGLTDPLGPEFEFDLTAQQAHITQSLRTVTSRFDGAEGGLSPPAAWASGTAYAVGDYATYGGNVYVVTTAGTSSGSGPTGTGTGITDGSVVWDFSAAAATSPIVAWTAATGYSSGDQVDSHGFVYECTTSGTSSATGDGPVGDTSGITDGSAVWKYVRPDLDPAAPDYGQAIGVTRDRVVGTDIYVGHLEFSITAQYYPVTLRVIETLLNLIGTFNQQTWYNFPTKTLLYLGCTGSPRPGNIWTLKHRFAASSNLRNVRIGSTITLPFKGGWDFLWCAYRDMVTTTGSGNSFNTQKPYAAYVEQVYRPGDYSTLPI